MMDYILLELQEIKKQLEIGFKKTSEVKQWK
jgi:hypothetical protein